MIDFLKKYKKKQTIGAFGIVAMSMVLALGMNLFVLDGSNLEQNIKASVLNYKWVAVQSDIYLDKQDSFLSLYTNTPIQQVQSLSVSLVHNPGALELSGFTSNLGTITILSHTPGISTILFTFTQAIDISVGSQLFEAEILKKSSTLEQINMIQANFSDAQSTVFQLSTSWIEL